MILLRNTETRNGTALVSSLHIREIQKFFVKPEEKFVYMLNHPTVKFMTQSVCCIYSFLGSLNIYVVAMCSDYRLNLLISLVFHLQL